eukprot:TRINITY_DN6428_c0_g1_i1.p1 TRINITY_DN6428_c0_g1~~TRINITY_DN6428_c0_g1_i1.p1  ORF type:complete len:330 (-),score=103.13 TRINITY_DN6428_c0_g1_i1:49-1038(-)
MEFDSFLKELSQLGFPGSRDLTEELVLSPGSKRYEIIEFLLRRFDPFQYFAGLKEIPSPTAGRITEGSLASRYAEFLNVLGLCSREDVALVRGTVEAEKNLKILQNLSKMAKASLVVNKKKQSVEEAYEKDEALLNRLALTQDSVFAIDGELFGRDIESQVQSELGLACEEMPCPEPEELEEKAQKIRTKLKILEMQRADLQDDIDGSARSREQSFNMNTLLSKLHNLSKLMRSFNEYFVSDLSSWTDKRTPIISGVGDASDGIHHPLATMQKMLENFKTMVSSLRHLMLFQFDKDLDAIDEEFPLEEIEQMEKHLEILETALTHQQKM